jgi:alkanesulfonate monooxygenase SsuD/methylene tetrahydromethanopterin reductase-like flavin-dependent oxidoreductase (luciferase family)
MEETVVDCHAFMYVAIGRRHELEKGMAGKDPVLYQRMLSEIGAYARLCDEAGFAGIGVPEHHLQIAGFEMAQEPESTLGSVALLHLGRRPPHSILSPVWRRYCFEECVDIIQTAWRHDTFAYTGKYWTFPAATKNPHDHPVYYQYSQGVDADGTIG